jgi:hypothetical protein
MISRAPNNFCLERGGTPTGSRYHPAETAARDPFHVAAGSLGETGLRAKHHSMRFTN